MFGARLHHHAEIAGRIGLTRERVRQLALKMVRDGRSRMHLPGRARVESNGGVFCGRATTRIFRGTARQKKGYIKREDLYSAAGVLANMGKANTHILP